MYRSEARKRKCTADNHKCPSLPMFVGTNIETGLKNEVACMGHVWLLGDPGYGMIQEDPEDVLIIEDIKDRLEETEVVCDVCGEDHYTSHHYNWCSFHQANHDPRMCGIQD